MRLFLRFYDFLHYLKVISFIKKLLGTVHYTDRNFPFLSVCRSQELSNHLKYVSVDLSSLHYFETISLLFLLYYLLRTLKIWSALEENQLNLTRDRRVLLISLLVSIQKFYEIVFDPRATSVSILYEDEVRLVNNYSWINGFDLLQAGFYHRNVYLMISKKVNIFVSATLIAKIARKLKLKLLYSKANSIPPRLSSSSFLNLYHVQKNSKTLRDNNPNGTVAFSYKQILALFILN